MFGAHNLVPPGWRSRAVAGLSITVGIISVTATVLAILAYSQGLRDIREIQDGRRIGTSLTCAIADAVLAAGRDTIRGAGSAPLPPRLEAQLVSLGYPPRAARIRAATLAAERYGQAISVRVVGLFGHAAKGVIRRDGTVDCQAVLAAANAR